jgi:hypothetical protein
MTLLRVAIISLHQDRLHVHCFGELPQLAAAVQILLSNEQRRFVIDAGFEDFENRESNRSLFAGEDRVLISDRALSILRAHISAETQLVVELDNVPFYAALTLWDKTCKEPRSVEVERLPKDWVAELSKHDSFLAEHARRVGIWDDASYRSVERQLSGALRVSLARCRFTLLAGAPPSPLTILDNIGCCPSWVQERRFDTLPINVRQANVMRAYHFNCIGDLAKAGTRGLHKLPNLGQKSVRELGNTVYDVLLSEPAIGAIPLQASLPDVFEHVAEDIPFFESLRRWLDVQEPAMATVIRSRWAVDTEKLTLKQLAPILGVTGERIRQIEVDGVSKLKLLPLWEEMASRIERILSRRTSPLRLKDLAEEDPWFVSKNGSTLAIETAIRKFLEGRIHTFEIDTDVLVSRLSENGWIRATNDARVILGNPSASGSAVRAEKLVTSILAGAGAELRSLLLTALDVDSTMSQPSQSTQCANNEDDLLAQKLRTEMLRRQLTRAA